IPEFFESEAGESFNLTGIVKSQPTLKPALREAGQKLEALRRSIVSDTLGSFTFRKPSHPRTLKSLTHNPCLEKLLDPAQQRSINRTLKQFTQSFEDNISRHAPRSLQANRNYTLADLERQVGLHDGSYHQRLTMFREADSTIGYSLASFESAAK